MIDRVCILFYEPKNILQQDLLLSLTSWHPVFQLFTRISRAGRGLHSIMFWVTWEASLRLSMKSMETSKNSSSWICVLSWFWAAEAKRATLQVDQLVCREMGGPPNPVVIYTFKDVCMFIYTYIYGYIHTYVWIIYIYYVLTWVGSWFEMDLHMGASEDGKTLLVNTDQQSLGLTYIGSSIQYEV